MVKSNFLEMNSDKREGDVDEIQQCLLVLICEEQCSLCWFYEASLLHCVVFVCEVLLFCFGAKS